MQTNLSLHLSKCHIFGNHMLWLNYSAKTLLAEYNANESKHNSRTTISAWLSKTEGDIKMYVLGVNFNGRCNQQQLNSHIGLSNYTRSLFHEQL